MGILVRPNMVIYGDLVAKISVLGVQNGFRAPQTQFGHQTPTKHHIWTYQTPINTHIWPPKHPYTPLPHSKQCIFANTGLALCASGCGELSRLFHSLPVHLTG